MKDTHENNSLVLAMKDMELNRKKLLQTQKIAGIGGFEYLPDEKLLILSNEACLVLGLSENKTMYSMQEFCKKVRKGKYDKFCMLLESASNDLNETLDFIIKDDKRELRYIEIYLEPPSGTLKGSITGVFHNVTRRKEAEMAKNSKSEAFDAIFSNAKLAILVMNLKGKVVDCNQSAINLLGYTRGEMLNNHSVQLLHPDDVMDASKMFATFVNSGGKNNFLEYRLKKKSNELIDVLINFEMTIGSEGERLFVFINDLTEIKAMERKNLDQERMLIQQSKMATLGEMVALIAHQWQQPINAIAMIVQMLEELIELDEQNSIMLNKSVESVMAQVSFMANTMDDFRHFLKPSNVKDSFNVHRIVKEVVSLYRPQLKHSDIDCNIFLSEDRVKRAEVFGYENELKNVILNFLTNSRDAIETSGVDKGNIHIVISEVGDSVQICIEDNGGGISDEMMKKIFNPYVSSKGDNGTGLGLYMSKLIIKDRMNGDITLENTKDGLRICIIFNKSNLNS